MRMGIFLLPVVLAGTAGCAMTAQQSPAPQPAVSGGTVGVWSDMPRTAQRPMREMVPMPPGASAAAAMPRPAPAPVAARPVAPPAPLPAAMPAPRPMPVAPSVPGVPVQGLMVETPAPARAPLPQPASVVASSNQCWVQSIVRPRPVQQAVDVVVRDPVNKLQVQPAVLGDGSKQVVTKAGTTMYEVQAPVYRPVTERVEIKPEVRRTVVVPAVFRDVSETVVIEAARTELEPCKAAGGVRYSNAPVSAMCAREIPAKTRTVQKKQLVTPETTKVVVEPAEYKEVTRWVLEAPAKTIPVQVPDETTKLSVKSIVRPEQVREQTVPAERQQIEATRYAGEPKLVTVPAVCDADINEPMILALQTVLQRAGLNPGELDGKLGRRTIEALLEYQLRNGLAYGALTYESLEHLGIR